MNHRGLRDSDAGGSVRSPHPVAVVTGAAGFIGSRLALRLLREGWSVIGVDAFTDSYDPAEKLERAAALVRHPRFRQISGDLVDLPLVEVVRGAEVVFHLAGRPGVRPSFRIADAYQHDNVEATVRLIDACRESTSVRRLVYASSSSIYGDAPLPFREDAPPAPISPYGRTKLEGERYCLAANGPELETVALRYFTVYGPGQRPDLALRRFAEQALRDRPVRLFGDGKQSRDFTFVDDIVEATYRAHSAPVAGLVVNVGGGSRIDLLTAFRVLEDLVGRPVRVKAEATAQGDVRHTEADLTRSRELLRFVPQVSFIEGYRREVEWLRQKMQSGGGTISELTAKSPSASGVALFA